MESSELRNLDDVILYKFICRILFFDLQGILSLCEIEDATRIFVNAESHPGITMELLPIPTKVFENFAKIASAKNLLVDLLSFLH